MTKTSNRISALTVITKKLGCSCVAAFALVALAGCACDQKSSATTVSTDTKDMNHTNSH